MSAKSKVLAAGAALALLAGAGAGVLTAGAAEAITPSCGPRCVDVFSHEFGGFGQPRFVLDVYKRAAKAGAPVILFRTSNVDQAEDFVISRQGSVSDFYKAGLVPAAVNLHYGGGAAGYPDDQAYEIEYAPLGVASGLCAGTAATAAQGTDVVLQPCGASSKTVWIVDTYDSPFTFSVPLINGSDTNFSHPFVLTFPAGRHPSDQSRPRLMTANLTGASNGITGAELGTVSSNQLWAADSGVLN